jgi:magnesium-transporting ATPase (P-type)
MERELFIVGVTAVEDRLQDQVPETIADFLKAS